MNEYTTEELEDLKRAGMLIHEEKKSTLGHQTTAVSGNIDQDVEKHARMQKIREARRNSRSADNGSKNGGFIPLVTDNKMDLDSV